MKPCIKIHKFLLFAWFFKTRRGSLIKLLFKWYKVVSMQLKSFYSSINLTCWYYMETCTNKWSPFMHSVIFSLDQEIEIFLQNKYFLSNKYLFLEHLLWAIHCGGCRYIKRLKGYIPDINDMGYSLRRNNQFN